MTPLGYHYRPKIGAGVNPMQARLSVELLLRAIRERGGSAEDLLRVLKEHEAQQTPNHDPASPGRGQPGRSTTNE